MEGIMGVAVVLDPRYKLEVLEFYFDKFAYLIENSSQLELFISTKKRKKVICLKSELDHYLDENLLAKTDRFDVLT